MCAPLACAGITAAPSTVPIPMPSAAPHRSEPLHADADGSTGCSVGARGGGFVQPADDRRHRRRFPTPAQQASFASAIESSLTIDATVTNIVATNAARRRLAIRKLLQSGVVVDYDLEVVIAAGWVLPRCNRPPLPSSYFIPLSRARTADSQITNHQPPSTLGQPTGTTADAVFAEAVADLTTVVTAADSPLMANLAQDLGVPVVVDATAFVAPTTYVQQTVTVKVPVPSPVLSAVLPPANSNQTAACENVEACLTSASLSSGCTDAASEIKKQDTTLCFLFLVVWVCMASLLPRLTANTTTPNPSLPLPAGTQGTQRRGNHQHHGRGHRRRHLLARRDHVSIQYAKVSERDAHTRVRACTHTPTLTQKAREW